jgi:hypothetical protein
VGAVSSGLDTVLVLTGVTKRDEIVKYPYQPTYVLESIGDIDLSETKQDKGQRKTGKTNEREAAVDKATK